MDIPQQLLKKYGPAFDFGLFAPTSANVEVAVAGFPAFHTQAGVYVGPDAKAWIWLSPISAHPSLLQQFLTAQVGEIVVKGTLADGRSLSVQRCATAHVNTNGAGGFISFKGGNMTANLTGPTTVVATLLVLSPLVVQNTANEHLADVKVRYTLINALFCGEQDTVKHEGGTKSSRRDRFTVQSAKYTWEIAWLAHFNKEQVDDLKSGLIQSLPTATMETPLDSVANPKEFDDEAEAITRLLTLATGIATTWVVREVWSGEKLIQQWFERKGLSTNAEGKARYEAISNLTDASALRVFLEETLPRFQQLESSLRLGEVVDYMEQARHQKVIQVRIAILVLCLELLSYQWCLQNGTITVIGTNSIRAGFDATCLQQALNARSAPGVTDLVLNPDAHAGYGAPVGCVLTSPTHVYPGPVGVDIKCSMSFLQLDLPADQVADKTVRRALINAILERTPTGPGRGQRSARKSRKVGEQLGVKVATDGASPEVLHALGIPLEWAKRCEDAAHVGHDETNAALALRLEWLRANQFSNFLEKITQLGSYGGGNHFGECEVVRLIDNARARRTAEVFGLRDGCVGFLSHCGSRGFGHALASGQFRALQQKFAAWDIPLPGGDKELVYAPLGTPEADAYLDDMALGANFATVNHLLINALVLEAFQEIIPSVKGSLVYFISHNIARKELLPDGHGGFAGEGWVHRKGATRAFPAGHPSLKDTPFAATGHPILLPGNPTAGSVIMTADAGAEKSAYSVNHGAGRCMGRKAADRALDQKTVDDEFVANDILTNCRLYPKDEAPAAYKDFDAVLDSVKAAGLASEVARLKARFVIKDADMSLRGAA